MKFVVSSSQLLAHLQSIARVINSKNTLPILDNFLFNINNGELVITASDLETTLTTKMSVDNTEEDGMIAIPSKILTDTLKEFPEQPLTFHINLNESTIAIHSANGKFNIVGNEGGDFPKSPAIKESATSIMLPPSALLNGISKTIFATSDDELKPVMNGIFVQLFEDGMTLVASDSHKLVRFRRTDVKSESESSFILPKKPAGLLKNILPKEDGLLKLSFDDKNAFFELTNYTMICRLIEGKYPAYQSVIPTNNPYKLIIDRINLSNSIRRVAVFSSQASNLIKLQMESNEIKPPGASKGQYGPIVQAWDLNLR